MRIWSPIHVVVVGDLLERNGASSLHVVVLELFEYARTQDGRISLEGKAEKNGEAVG
jgi:hypothetical protein